MQERKVLVVDDDRLIVWALRKELASASLDLHVAGNGRDALAAVREHRYDLVLLDVHLPDANGIALLKTIRGMSPATKVIMISADVSTGNVQGALAEGALQFIEKPFEISLVTGLVKDVLEGNPARRRHPRLFCRIPLRISVADPAPEEALYDLENLDGTALDIGPGGLRLATDYPLREGQRIRLEAVATDDLLRMFLPPEPGARVRWVSAAGGKFTAGVSFLS